MIRNPIYDALKQQLSDQLLNVAPNNVQRIERGFVHWDQVDEQPAIFVTPRTEGNRYERGTPNLWNIGCDLYVYVRWVDSVEQGVKLLASVMDAIETAIAPTGPYGSRSANFAVNTLGGLVSYCALNGTSQISGGFLNKQQTIALMPVDILVPG